VIVFINGPLDYEVLPVEPQCHYREPFLEPVVNLLFSATARTVIHDPHSPQ
jgi:hypothetical protein